MVAETEGPSGAANEPSRETPKGKSANRNPQPSKGAGLIAVTLEPASGRIVKVETVDEAGARRELNGEEKAALAEQAMDATLEDILEQAFEAGISSVLYPRDEADETPESEEDALLRRLILRPMIKRSAAHRLMKREVLGRAILGTLIQGTPELREPDHEPGASRSRAAGSGGTRRSAPRGRTRH